MTTAAKPEGAGAATTTPNPLEDTVKKQEQLIAQQQAALQRLNNQFDDLNKRVSAPPAPPPKQPGQAAREFLDNPEERMEAVIKRVVAPINEEVNNLRAERYLNQQKSKYKADPKLAKIWSAIEPYIDNALLSGTAPVNENTIAATVSWAVGQYHMGNIAAVKDETPVNKQDDRLETPPHLRPTSRGSELPPIDGKPKLRELTENERVLARKRGMTDEQWLTAIDLRPDQVVTHEYRPKPKA